ncbi:DoxX family protein [Mucilaginibacter achroorhodeus]|uniref:DoxX family protein n=1 Tax=Mucilaginibacter achroorhodeus TaxID=2599294 RepID=A0A563U1X9_9SPHI|nr:MULTISPECIES: DoxX family protein [Mucilaginibacter]QXV64054.1 DoxX family protein [Mucilaginibacter sp. 21P]TWR25510.1 DoxX family protein [Mucilaginibacter achroorhodeus]
MKKVKIAYWIFTILLVLMMGFSAVMSFNRTPESDKMMAHIGIVPQMMVFLAVFKILGILAILTPGLPKLKEWAYAGFTFDILGAIYLFIVAGDPVQAWAPILVALVLIFGSYIFWRKKTDLLQRKSY